MVRDTPRRNGYGGNVCAFCHYWEGDANLHSYGMSKVEFDGLAKGMCLKTRGTKYAQNVACPAHFELSNEASRYVK